MKRARTLALVAMMAALSNVLSIPPLAVPIQLGGFTSSVHFFQFAIFICGILAGPWAGLFCGAIGGLYMSVTKIPFVAAGIAILGVSVGFFSKRCRPTVAGLLAWLVQAPYVIVTDYVWFTVFVGTSPATAWALILPIMINLTLQAVVCAIIADIVVSYVRRTGLSTLE